MIARFLSHVLDDAEFRTAARFALARGFVVVRVSVENVAQLARFLAAPDVDASHTVTISNTPTSAKPITA